MRHEQQSSPRLRVAVEAELEPGERIQWLDVPAPKWFTGKSIGAVLFAIPWTAFAVWWVFWMSGSADSKSSDESTDLTHFLGVPFVLFGIGMLLSPVFEYRRSLRTVYAITDRRALILETGAWRKVSSYAPSQLKRVYHKDRTNGLGDVILSTRTWQENDLAPEEIGFMRIENSSEVERMLVLLAEQVDEADV